MMTCARKLKKPKPETKTWKRKSRWRETVIK